jgi:hypothetical protein
LSTTAIKDGHRGSAFPSAGHHHHHSTNTLEAERADRISRLAGLERVGTVRPNAPGGGGNPAHQGPHPGQIPGYFDAQGNPVYTTKISTVGSASATDSAEPTTTWTSASGQGHGEDRDDHSEADQMSMDTNYREIDDRDRYSMMDMSEDGDGMSDEGNVSLVGFGEGAGSTVSGPTYTRSRAAQLQAAGAASPASTATGATTMSAIEQRKDARMVDGIADDASSGFVDTTTRSPVQSRGVATAERIVRERLDQGEGKQSAMSTPEEASLGKFYVEERK